MSQSRQFLITGAVATALGGNAAGAWRCRFSDFGTAELPADNVIPEEETSEYADTSGIDRHFRFHVRHLAAAATDADMVADARYVRGAQLLLADATLGGLTRRLREIGRKWEMEKSELQVVALVVTYECEFSTGNTDPSQPGY